MPLLTFCVFLLCHFSTVFPLLSCVAAPTFQETQQSCVPYSNFNTHPLQTDLQGNLGISLKTRQLRADRKMPGFNKVIQECLKYAGEEKSNRSSNRWCMRQYWNHPLHHTERMTSAHTQHKSQANCNPLRKWASLFCEFTKMQRLDFSTPTL